MIGIKQKDDMMGCGRGKLNFWFSVVAAYLKARQPRGLPHDWLSTYSAPKTTFDYTRYDVV